MNSKFQLKMFRANLCFVINSISTPTTPSQENGGRKQHLCQNMENQTHQMFRIPGAIGKHADSSDPTQNLQRHNLWGKGLGNLMA